MKKILISFFIVWILIGFYYLSRSNKISSNIESVVVSVPSPTPIPHLDSMKIYNLVNDYRASQGLNKLVFDPSMCDFARKRLSQIPTNWSHQGFYPEVLSYYQYTDAGENLGRDFKSENEAIDFWTKSTTHLENIVKPVYTRTCVASDIKHVVQEFASY